MLMLLPDSNHIQSVNEMLHLDQAEIVHLHTVLGYLACISCCKPVNKSVFGIRCIGAGKHLKHAGQGVAALPGINKVF